MANKLIWFTLVAIIYVCNSCNYAKIPNFVKKQHFNFSTKKYNSVLFSSKKGYFGNIDSSDIGQILVLYENNICAMAYLGSKKDEIEKNFHEIRNNKKHYFYRGGGNTYWGTYLITGDTLKTKIVNRPSLISPIWGLFEDHFVMTDSGTIYLSTQKQTLSDKNLPNELKVAKINNKSFHECELMPEFNGAWILDNKWFWKDKNEYKDWKEKKK